MMAFDDEYDGEDDAPLFTVNDMHVDVDDDYYPNHQRLRFETSAGPMQLSLLDESSSSSWRLILIMTILAMIVGYFYAVILASVQSQYNRLFRSNFWYWLQETSGTPIEMPELVVEEDEKKESKTTSLTIHDDELPPAFRNKKDYPKGWMVYHRVLGVVTKDEADKFVPEAAAAATTTVEKLDTNHDQNKATGIAQTDEASGVRNNRSSLPSVNVSPKDKSHSTIHDADNGSYTNTNTNTREGNNNNLKDYSTNGIAVIQSPSIAAGG